MSRHLSIRDLQKISGAAIKALPGPTAVKSGDRTVAVLIPIKSADPERMAATLAKARALAAERDPAADEALLERMARGEPEPEERPNTEEHVGGPSQGAGERDVPHASDESVRKRRSARL